MPVVRNRKVRSRTTQATYSRMRGRGLGSFLSGIANKVMSSKYMDSEGTARPGFPGEHHAILKMPNGVGRANFMGPGTAIVERIARGDPPRTFADKVSEAHDIRMSFAKSTGDVAASDQKMVSALSRGQAQGLDSKINLAMGKYPIMAKAAAEKYGVIPFGKIHSYGEHNPADYPQMAAKLRELEQEGLGRARKGRKPKPKKEPKPEMPSDALKLAMIKQTVKDHKKGTPKTTKKMRVRLMGEPMSESGGGAEAAAMMSDAPTVSSANSGSAGRTGGALKLAGQGDTQPDFKTSGFINPRELAGQGSTINYNVGAGLSIAGSGCGGGIVPTLGGALALAGAPMEGSGTTTWGASGRFGSADPAVNAIQHKFISGHVIPFVMRSFSKSGLVGKKYIDLVLKHPEFKRTLDNINSVKGASFDHSELLGSGTRLGKSYAKQMDWANNSGNALLHGVPAISMNAAHKLLPFLHMAKVMEHRANGMGGEGVGETIKKVIKFATSDVGKKLYNVINEATMRGVEFLARKAAPHVMSGIKKQHGLGMKGMGKVRVLANGLDFSGSGFFSSLRDAFSRLWQGVKPLINPVLKMATPLVGALAPEALPALEIAKTLGEHLIKE